MKKISRVSAAGLVTVLASLCAACGGGGGGGGGSGPPSFTLSTASITFNGTNNGSAPADQTVTATALNGTVYFSIQTSGNALANASLSCSGSTCTILLTPVAPVGLGTGTLNSTVVVTGCTASVGCGSQVASSPQTINISYVIAPGPVLSSNPAVLGVQTTPTTAPPQQTLALGSTLPAAWTSSVSYLAGGNSSWLTVPGSGNAPQNVSVGVSALPVGAYRAQVTFTPTGGGGSVSVMVVAVSHNQGAAYVAPYVAIAGSAQSAIVRGSGFASLSAAQTQVLFGATAGSNVTVVSDTEIKATVPALAAGAYPVTVKDNAQTLQGNPTLTVVAAPAYAYAKIARAANTDPVPPGELLYDAVRGAIYLYDVNGFGPAIGGQYADEIERYRFSAGAWGADVLYAFSPLGQQLVQFSQGSLSLAADGSTLVRSGFSTVDQVDPVAGTLLSTTAASDTFGVNNYVLSLGVGTMTNTGMLLGSAHLTGPVSSPVLPDFVYFYDVPTQAFLPAPAPPGTNDISNFTFTGSLDESTVLMTEGGALPVFALVYDAGSASYPISGGLGTLNSSLASLSFDGSRALMHADTTRYAVVDFSAGMSNLRGYLPAADAVVISPDGTRGFEFVASTLTIHVYDLTAAVNGNGQYPEIGTGLVLADAPSASGTNAVMIITPDGGTLILAGTTNVIVTPKPPG
jgi:hypothetical protein